MKETIADNTLKTLRNVLFKEMMDLRNGEVESEHATSICKVSSQIIASYKTEIDAVRTANDLKDKNIVYVKNLKSIVTDDVLLSLQ